MNKKKNRKIETLVETARTLFWRYGFRRVSIEEICRMSGVSKTTFYKFFINKSELINHLLDTWIDESLAKYKSIMDSDLPYDKKVRKTIELKLAQTDDLSQEILQELVHNPIPEVAAHLQEKKDEMLKVILEDYRKAQQKGEIRTDINLKFILYFLNHLVEMVEDERLVSLYESPQELISELTNFFFFGILPRNR